MTGIVISNHAPKRHSDRSMRSVSEACVVEESVIVKAIVLYCHEKKSYGAVPSFRPKWRNLFVAKVQSLTDVSTSLNMTFTSHTPLSLRVLRSK